MFHVAWDFAVGMFCIFDVDDASGEELVREGADLAIITNQVHVVDECFLRSSEKYVTLKEAPLFFFS